MTAWRTWLTLWHTLTAPQRRRFLWLQALSVLMAVSTVSGLAAVVAFLSVFADPTLAGSIPGLAWLRRSFDGSAREFALILGAGFIVVLAVSALVNVRGSRAIWQFAYAAGDRVRQQLLASYLRRDWLFHARVGTARLTEDLLYQTDRVISSLVNAQMLCTNLVLTLLVVGLIAVVNPWVAIGGMIAAAAGYAFFYRLIRRRLTDNGRALTSLSARRTAVLAETFAGIKFVLLSGAQRAFERRFAEAARPLSAALADTHYLGLFPRYVLESAAGVALIACGVLLSQGASTTHWLAPLSFIGIAGFRLLPAFHQMYNGVVAIRGHWPALRALASQLRHRESAPCAVEAQAPASMPLRRTLELVNLSFRYPQEPWVLTGVSLRIRAGSIVGIVGVSGSGKTTLVDVIVGLLTPEQGHIEIDGVVVDSSSTGAWRRSIGYVPQEIALLDASVSENIAFGVDVDAIDLARVRAVARQAGAHEFIEALPGGYSAPLSASSRSLSGGQRQRIGIARALYAQPSLLVFDEATRSLDPASEQVVVDALLAQRGVRTVLVVAHQGAVLEACDVVYELRQGRIHETRGTRLETAHG